MTSTSACLRKGHVMSLRSTTASPVTNPMEVNDLSTLEEVSEDNILTTLKGRWQRAQPYVSMTSLRQCYTVLYMYYGVYYFIRYMCVTVRE